MKKNAHTKYTRTKRTHTKRTSTKCISPVTRLTKLTQTTNVALQCVLCVFAVSLSLLLHYKAALAVLGIFAGFTCTYDSRLFLKTKTARGQVRELAGRDRGAASTSGPDGKLFFGGDAQVLVPAAGAAERAIFLQKKKKKSLACRALLAFRYLAAAIEPFVVVVGAAQDPKRQIRLDTHVLNTEAHPFSIR